jgi:aminoglycoside phosphotransferase family enzyme/predicted kinase
VLFPNASVNAAEEITMTSRGQADRGADDSLPPLISALRDAACFDHPTDAIVVLETHISYVLLTGPYAYKIKKPVSLPFLDFSTLEFRKHYCDEELRINRRLASELYVDVVPITGTQRAPRMNGEGRAIEYAVKMVQFPDADRLDRVADRGELRDTHVRALVAKIAAFHANVAVADPKSPFADSEHLRKEVMENFESLSAQSLPADTESLLEEIRAWSSHSLVDHGRLFRSRKQDGWIRECHGDMHLANMALLNGQVTIFDALEFNENLRWIDVQSELAFLAMDIDYRGLEDLGWLLVSGYLETTGDYSGLHLLRHYAVYRAMVRAKVAALRAGQCASGTREHDTSIAELASHVNLAHSLLQPGRPTPLVITHGLSGSGKTWLTERLLRVVGAIRVRSDVERQRLAGAGEIHADALYSPRAVSRTYEALADHARIILECGYPAIVDATFLKRAYRQRFLSLARELDVPFVILSLHAPASVLEARVAERLAEAADASEATVDVLRGQRSDLEPLDDEEREAAVDVRGDAELDLEALAGRLLRGRGSAPLVRRLDYRVRDEH